MQTIEFVPGTQVLVIEDQPHPLEEALHGAAEDNDNRQIMNIFAGLYKEGKTEEIEYILQRQLLNPKQIATAIEKIAEHADQNRQDRQHIREN